jgi:hypothetical protein
MKERQMDMEDRAFELFGERGLTDDERIAILAREFGATHRAAFDTARKVLKERGTPNLAAAREALARVEAVLPYLGSGRQLPSFLRQRRDALVEDR